MSKIRHPAKTLADFFVVMLLAAYAVALVALVMAVLHSEKRTRPAQPCQDSK